MYIYINKWGITWHSVPSRLRVTQVCLGRCSMEQISWPSFKAAARTRRGDFLPIQMNTSDQQSRMYTPVVSNRDCTWGEGWKYGARREESGGGQKQCKHLVALFPSSCLQGNTRQMNIPVSSLAKCPVLSCGLCAQLTACSWSVAAPGSPDPGPPTGQWERKHQTCVFSIPSLAVPQSVQYTRK